MSSLQFFFKQFFNPLISVIILSSLSGSFVMEVWLQSAELSFFHLNANEHAAIAVKELQKQCEFLISYRTKR